MREIPLNQPSSITRSLVMGRTTAHSADRTGEVVTLPVQWRGPGAGTTPCVSPAAQALARVSHPADPTADPTEDPTADANRAGSVTKVFRAHPIQAREAWLERMWRFSDTSPAHAATGFLVFHGGPCDTTIAAGLDASLRAHIRGDASRRRWLSPADLGAAGGVLRQRLANLDAGQKAELAERISLAERRVVGAALLRCATAASRDPARGAPSGDGAVGDGAVGDGAVGEETAREEAAATARDVVAQSARWRAWLTRIDTQPHPPPTASHRAMDLIRAPAAPRDPGGHGHTPHPIFGWDVAAEIADATLDVMDDLLR